MTRLFTLAAGLLLVAALPLARANLSSPLLWAVVVAWIITVVFHEFAHGIVAYWGGDYTIKERGGLTLNPLQYIDPVMSVLLPAIFVLMGGVPLVGGATYIRTDLLRSKAWQSAMSLAGPTMNLLICALLCGLMHPALGLFDLTVPADKWSDAQVVFASLAFLQAFAVVLNLLPVPPLDGFNAVAPYLPPDLVARVRQPGTSLACLVVLFVVLNSTDFAPRQTVKLMLAVLHLTGVGPQAIQQIAQSLGLTLG